VVFPGNGTFEFNALRIEGAPKAVFCYCRYAPCGRSPTIIKNGTPAKPDPGNLDTITSKNINQKVLYKNHGNYSMTTPGKRQYKIRKIY